jgi:methyltransferase (TIGR00027 family)
MEPSKRSRTIEIPAIMRALHQSMDGDPKILTDPIAPRLIEPAVDRAWLAPLLDHSFAKQWRAGFALRARYAEDCLADGAQRGVRQYVVLGAGLDTFAYRQPLWAASLRIYEVDHPATQLWKHDRLKAADIAIPSNLRFVPIDFERASIREALSATDFTLEDLTLCSWMGVTQYLSADAMDATFRFVLCLAPSSEIVFSLILPQDAVSGEEAEALAVAAQRSAEAGEPWLTRFDPSALAARLRSLGFSRIIHLTPQQAH